MAAGEPAEISVLPSWFAHRPIQPLASAVFRPLTRGLIPELMLGLIPDVMLGLTPDAMLGLTPDAMLGSMSMSSPTSLRGPASETVASVRLPPVLAGDLLLAFCWSPWLRSSDLVADQPVAAIELAVVCPAS